MFSGAFKEKKKIPAAMYIIILFLNHIMLFSTVSGAFLPPHTTVIMSVSTFKTVVILYVHIQLHKHLTCSIFIE
jgi:hypothetical protein